MKKIKTIFAIIIPICFISIFLWLYTDALAAPDIDNDNGVWTDSYNDIAGIFTSYSNGITHNASAGLIELSGATNGYFTTVKIAPPRFDAWGEMEIIANRAVQNQVSYEIYYDDQGALPPLATPTPVLSGILPISGRVDLSSLDVNRGSIRVRVILDGSLPIPKPTIDQISITWNPRSVVLLDKLGPDTVTVGNSIQYVVRYSVSYVEAKDLIIYDTLPTVDGTNDPDSTVIYPEDYGQDDAPFFNLNKNTISDGGQYTAGGIIVNGVVIPPNSIYWDLGDVAAGTAGTLQFNLSTRNGDLGRHSDETGTIVNNIAHSRASNADDASSAIFTTEYIAVPRPNLLKTPGNNIGSLDGIPTALEGTIIEYIFRSPYGPTDNNDWANGGRETMYESVLYDDVSDFTGKINTGYGDSGFNITGSGIYSATYVAPDGSGPFPAVVWDIGTLTPGANFDRRFTVQPVCPGGNPTSITNTAYLDSARTDPVSSTFDLNVICTAEPGWNHYKADELNGHRGVTGIKTFDDDTYLPGLNTNWATYGDNLKYLLTMGNSGFTDNHDGFIFDRIQPISTTLTSVEPLPAGYTGQIYYSTDPGFTDELTPPDYDNSNPLVDIDTGGNTYWAPLDPLNPPADIEDATWLAWYVEEIATDMFDSSIITDSVMVGFDVLLEPISTAYACEARTYTNTSSAAVWRYNNGSALVDINGSPPATTSDTEITYIRPEVGVFELDPEISPSALPIPGTATYTLRVRNLDVAGSDTFTDTYVDLNWSQISVYGVPQYPSFISIDGGSVDFSDAAQFDPSNGYIRVNLGPMVPGESRNITLELQLAGGSLNQESYSVTAKAVGSDDICDPVVSSANAGAAVTNGPKLEIVKNDVLNVINAGSHVTYTLNYRNVGTGASLNTIVGDRVPENMVFVSAEEPAGTTFYVSTDTDLPPAELARNPLTFDLITSEFTPAPSGVCPFTNTADCERITWIAWLVDDVTVDPPQLPSDGVFKQVSFKTRNDEDSTAAQVDSLPGTLIFNTSGIYADNSLPAISNEVVTTITDIPSLDLEKNAQAEVSSGETMDYVITYKNASEADNPTVWITDTLPVGAIYISAEHSWNDSAIANGAPADNSSQPVPTNIVNNPDGSTDLSFNIASFRNGDILSDEGGVITITVQVDGTVFKSGDLLTNSVCGRAYNASGDVSFICDDVVTEVVNADLQVIKLVDENEPPAGSTVTWLLNVSNEGRKEATNTVIRDTLPPNVTYITNSASLLTPGYVFMDTGNNTTAIDPVISGTPATGQVLEFSIAQGNAVGQDGEANGYFPPTSGAVYISFQTTLDGGITPSTTMTNTVTVSTDSIEDVSDTCPLIECPNEDTATITTPLPDPLVIKSGPTLSDPGGSIEWTLSYRNQNNEAASNVYLIDTLPDHNGDDATDLQFISTSGDRPSGAIPAGDIYYSAGASVPAFDPSGPSGDWTNDVGTLGTQPRHIAYIIGTVAARSAVYEITIQGILNDPGTGDPLAAGLTLENSVTIYADEDDDPSNNTDTASTETPGLEMAITKTGDPEGIFPGAVPGDTIAYTLEIENNGTTIAYGVKISDTLPAEVTANSPFDTVTLLTLSDENGNTIYPVDTSGTAITSDITVERIDDGQNSIWYLGLGPGNEADSLHYRKVGIPAGAIMSFDIFVTISGDVADQTTITNPAQVIVDRQNDLDPAEKYLVNNRDTSYVNVYRADLTTDKTVVDVATGSETQTSAGSVLSYTVTYNNIGNTAAENAVLTDNLPTNTCLILGSIQNPAGTSIEYSNNDGASWDYSPTADINGTDCTVTDYRVVFGSPIPAPANSYGEAPANLSLPSGPLLWLDGQDESTIGTTCSPTCGVSEWRDKSGNSFHFTQTVTSAMPVTLNNGINFDGSDDYLVYDTLPNPEDLTVFIVAASDTNTWNTSGWYLSNRSANGLLVHPWQTANDFSFLPINSSGANQGFARFNLGNLTSPHIVGMTFDDDSNQYQQLLNGSIVNSGTRAFDRDDDTSGKYYIGTDDKASYGSSRHGDGTIYEIIIYDRVLSQAELDQTSRYLSVKWGIPYTGGDNVVYDGTLLDSVCGNGSASSPFIDVGCLDGVATGTYWFNIDGNTFQGYVDGDTDGGGWLMVLNYLHEGNTSPATVPMGSSLPLLGSNVLGTNENGTVYWGHANNALMTALNIDEMRFYGETSAHSRILHFSTRSAAAIEYSETGIGNMTDIVNNYTTFADHTAFLPAQMNNVTINNQGDYALTVEPYRNTGDYHWNVNRGGRWEVDDYPNNDDNDTIHRIFVRKDSVDVFVPSADHLVCLAPLPNVGCEDGLICAPFDEGTGTSTEDISGNNNDLTLNSVPWIDNRDERGTYLDFTDDGTSDYAIIENLDMPTEDITLSLWASSNFTSSIDTMVSYAAGSSHNEFMFSHQSSGGLTVWINGPSSESNYYITDSDWHHIAMTWETSSGELKFFVDGTRVYSTTFQTGSPIDTGGYLVLAQDQDSLGGRFDDNQDLEGYMDDFRLYDRVLSEAEILAIADGSSDTIERFKTTGTYTTTVTADDAIGVWDKLLLAQELPEGSSIEYEILDATGTTTLFGPSSAPADYLDISAIDPSNTTMILVARLISDNSAQTCLNEWQATYSSDEEPFFTFQARVEDQPVDPSLVHNEVSISTTTPETDITNNDGFDDIAVETVNLSVEKLVELSAVLIGETITYTINFENEGPGTAANVALTDTLPVSVTHVSTTPSVGSCNPPAGQDIVCDLGTVGPLASGTVTVVVTADASAADEIIFNGVSIGSRTNEITLSDNTDSVPTYVGNIANIAITKVGPNAFNNNEGTAVELGELITYTLSYENNGTGNAANTIITDTLPSGTTYSGYSATPAATCTHASGTVVCTLGTLNPGDSGNIDVGVTVDNDPNLVGTTLENITVITTDDYETTLADNSDSFENPVELKSASLSGYVWFDTDQDVNRELATGEGPISGVEIQLTGTDLFGNSVVLTTTTNSAGFYAFSNLNPSNASGYTLTEIQPAGYQSTGSDIGQIAGIVDSNATNPTADQITGILLSSGEQGQFYNFGEVAPVSIGDVVWNDYNGNGQQDDGEAVLPGVTVTLYYNGAAISTTVTAGDGTYLFTNDGASSLYDGDYFVEFTAPSGYAFTIQDASGISDVIDSDADPLSGRTMTVTADLGDDILTLDAGLLIPSSIGDTVWLDLDGDGVEDTGEPGIPGVVITATADNGLVLTTTTDATGFYEFTGLGADTFTITVDTATLPIGLTQTGDPGGGTSLDDQHTETLNPGDDVDTVDFGYQGSGSIGDTVWLDLDGDGNEDTGEGGIGGVVITLTAASGFQITTTTTITGFYEFTNLPADDYTVSVDASTLPAGVTQTADPGGSGSLDNQHSLTLGNGQAIDTVDFGYIGNSALGDYVWQDLDGDGNQDIGEPPIPSVVITLTQPSGAVITTTTTITGFYQFTDLAAGTYQVNVDTSTLPTGLTQTGDPGGLASMDDSHTQLLGSNQTIDTVDFGYHSGGSLGDTVWYDLNGNGIEDPSEPGIPGVVITLTLPSSAVITTTTATNGFYQFTGLGTGNHTVTVDTSTLPTGLSQSGDPDSTLDDEHVYNLALNEAADTVDFGYVGSGSIGDTVWEDLDGDGIEDLIEPGIPNVVITLTTGTGGQITTTTTITGFYEFPWLPADTYTVTVDTNTLPIGYGQSGDPDSTLDNTHTTILTTGETEDTVDFGYLTSAELGNFVWLDTNGNGIQDVGESGFGNITVTLTVSDTGQVFTTTTSASGHYTFTNLLPGSYQVTFYPPADYAITTQGAGGDNTVDSDADPNTGITQSIILVSGDSDMSWDAGLYEPAALGNYVWADENANGLQDFGEPGIPEVTVSLILSGTGVITTTVTDSAGFYSFENLPPGEYAVEFTKPDKFYPTLANQGDDALDSDMSTIMLQTDFVTLESGDVDNTLDAGFYPGGSLGDYVWEDLDGNGIQDVGEPSVPGVTVTLYLSGTGQISATVTAADGSYTFDGLESGTYTMTFTSPVGYEIIDQTDAGNNDVADSDADSTTGQTGLIDLAPNEHDPTIDAGLYQPASLGNLVWADANGDGIQDPSELGFPDITVTLIMSGTSIITSTITDANGNYTFDGLPPSDYIVEFTLPPDYIVSPFERSNNEAVDSNTLFLGNQTEPITLASDDNNPTIDVGLYHPLQLGNLVWFDLNDNGVQDIGENGVEGVVLQLLDGDGNPILNPSSTGAGVPYTTTTSFDGRYSFDYLAPGEYIVEILPENFEAWDAPLYGFLSSLSTIGTAPVDPDNDDNTDDNGQNSLDPVASGGAQPDPITLGFGSEPASDGAEGTFPYPDTSTNLTVDFGFFEMLTIGNLIWHDVNSNGVQDIGEPGMPAGIELQLMDSNGDLLLNPETGLPITTTTQANGFYQFTNLAPGDYVVFITPENFQSGGPLEGYSSSAGSSDPDNDSNIDDNGLDEVYPTINGIYSSPITINYQEEPDNFADGDNNSNTNFTIDFGLIQVPTAVELIQFEAKLVGLLEVRLAWATASEVNNFGFRLLRSNTGRFDDAIEVHFEESSISNSFGATYAYWDTLPEAGTYTYWLIDVETTGLEVAHSPVVVQAAGAPKQSWTNFIYLPIVLD